MGGTFAERGEMANLIELIIICTDLLIAHLHSRSNSRKNS